MAGQVPAIHVFVLEPPQEDVDARDKRGHDADTLIQYDRNMV